MDAFQTIILALIQGLTEFLPVSSSAHLIFPSQLFGWVDQGLSFDVAVHFGTLTAVMLYYRRWLYQIGRDVLSNPQSLWFAIQESRGRVSHSHQAFQSETSLASSRLCLQLFVASVPIFIVGGLLEYFFPEGIRSTAVIAWSTIVFGLVLWASEYYAKGQRSEYEIGLKIALIIGLAQVLALIPGTSRSGITISAALFLGMSAQGSANFSFLLSIPTILAASLIKLLGLIQTPTEIEWFTLILGATVSGFFAYLTIEWFLGFLKRVGVFPFVVYRMFLGVLLLAFFS